MQWGRLTNWSSYLGIFFVENFQSFSRKTLMFINKKTQLTQFDIGSDRGAWENIVSHLKKPALRLRKKNPVLRARPTTFFPFAHFFFLEKKM